MKTDDKTLVSALRILVNDIQSEDGVANACIAEAAGRLEELIPCNKCYNKGYSTRAFDEIGAEDFGGDGHKFRGQTEIKPCSCEFGSRIKEVISLCK